MPSHVQRTGDDDGLSQPTAGMVRPDEIWFEKGQPSVQVGEIDE